MPNNMKLYEKIYVLAIDKEIKIWITSKLKDISIMVLNRSPSDYKLPQIFKQMEHSLQDVKKRAISGSKLVHF